MAIRRTRDNRTSQWREQAPGRSPIVADRYKFDTAPVITMRELNQRTSAVMDEINEHGCPTLVTKRGRFVAMITPLQSHSIESLVLSTDPALQALLPGEGESVDDDADLTVEEFRRHLRVSKNND